MSISGKILLGCVAMLCVTIALGLYERQQAAALGRLAVNVYEQSLMGISYARSAQVGFMRYAGGKPGATAKDVLDDLDVAISRVGSGPARDLAVALRKGLASSEVVAAADLDDRFDTLVETLTADAFTQRSNVDTMIAATEQSIRLALGGSVAIAVLIASLLGASIVRPIRRGVAFAGAIADGRLNNVIPTKGRSETARLSQALDRMQSAIAAANAEREAHHAENEMRNQTFKTEMKEALREMAESVEAEAATALDEVGGRTRAMADSAASMRDSAERTGESSREATRAAGRALATSQAVASAAEQLSVSIREISAQVNHSTGVVSRAVVAGAETRERIDGLSKTVSRIGAVAGMIGEIAARTNLLALNATIEAARAGDAGKGFAVVAGEVKQLAAQTARSTAEIGGYLREVQTATSGTIDAVRGIEQTIREVDAISVAIAAAVEQQGAATAEIARNVTETAQAAEVVHEQIERVAAEAAIAGERADEVGGNARGLAVAVSDLKRAVVRAVRTSTEDVNRRAHPRYPAEIPCRLITEDHGTMEGRLADVSQGGARLEGTTALPRGVRGVLAVDGGGLRLPATVQGGEDNTIRLVFALDEAQTESWRRFLERFTGRLAA